MLIVLHDKSLEPGLVVIQLQVFPQTLSACIEHQKKSTFCSLGASGSRTSDK